MTLLNKYKLLSYKKKSFCFSLLFLILHGIFTLYFVLSGFSSENSAFSTVFIVFGIGDYIFLLAFAVFSRIKLYRVHLTGFFFYGLIGILFFAIALVEKLANGYTAGGVFQSVFDWYTIMTRPVCYILSPLIGMSEFFRKGIVFGLIVVIYGSLSSGAGKEIKFNESKR